MRWPSAEPAANTRGRVGDHCRLNRYPQSGSIESRGLDCVCVCVLVNE